MELSDLRIFRTVVNEGGITRAAERLHRVQSNVTTRIRKLETELGVPLFIREGKRLILAPAGRRLLDYADRLLELAAEAEAAVTNPVPGGVLKLGAMESTAAIRLPPLLSELNRRHPGIQLELRTGNPTQLARSLQSGEIDAALAAEPVDQALFDGMIAFDEETILITSADHSNIDANARAPDTMIVFEKGCPHRRLLEAWYAERDALPKQTIELASYHAMIGCVLAGMGAALLPESVLSTFPETERLRCHALPPGKNRLKTLLFWRRPAASPNVAALAEILQARGGPESRLSKRKTGAS